jgi:diadenosine tetraphosphate (Ap4A) HIT family hydrolase
VTDGDRPIADRGGRPRCTIAVVSSSFLDLPESSWVASNALAFAIPAPVPEGRGHILVVARRLILTWFEATPEERAAIFEVVDLA